MAKDKQMNGYALSRDWFNFCFENPEKIAPIHTALYFFCIEHYNRLGWKDKFGLPAQMVMEAIGVKNWKTYIKTFNDLVEWGFIKVIERSRNQYSATIVAIVKNTKATTEALTKAMQMHSPEHSTEQCPEHSRGTASVDKPRTREPRTKNLLVAKATLSNASTHGDASPSNNSESSQGEERGNHISTETEKKESSAKEKKEYCQKVADYFNKTCPSLPAVQILTKERIRAICARTEEHGKGKVKQMIDRASESSFLAGQNPRSFVATFDWMFRPRNFVKVFENNFRENEQRNKKDSTPTPEELVQSVANGISRARTKQPWE